jgi:excisionase family DNA binding protein
MGTEIEPLLVGRRQAAEALGISVRKLSYLIAEGVVVSRKIGSRRLVPVAALREFAAPSPQGDSPARDEVRA